MHDLFPDEVKQHRRDSLMSSLNVEKIGFAHGPGRIV